MGDREGRSYGLTRSLAGLLERPPSYCSNIRPMPISTPPEDANRVRLDKWLWAARFYKTRSLAKSAVDGGKVHLNGARTKPAKEVVAGDRLIVTRGGIEQTIVIAAVSERRGGASIAATLFDETPESVDARARIRADRRMQAAGLTVPKSRPNKKQRRALRDLKTNA